MGSCSSFGYEIWRRTGRQNFLLALLVVSALGIKGSNALLSKGIASKVPKGLLVLMGAVGTSSSGKFSSMLSELFHSSICICLCYFIIPCKLYILHYHTSPFT